MKKGGSERRNMTRNLFALKSCYGQTDGIDTETNVCCWSNFNLYINPRSVVSREQKGKPQFSRGWIFSCFFLVMCATCFNLWLSAIHYEYLMIFSVRSSVEHFYLTRSSSTLPRLSLRHISRMSCDKLGFNNIQLLNEGACDKIQKEIWLFRWKFLSQFDWFS